MADDTQVQEGGEESQATEEQTQETAAEEAAPAEAASSDQGDKDAPVPDEFKSLVEQVENMSVLELNELVKVLEKRFGVSASAVAVAAPGAGGGAAAEEKTDFTVELTDGGASKIAVIKVVKAALNLGLKEAKDLVEGAPAVLKEGMKKEDAEALKAEIEGAGGKVTLK